jgi:putative addiction module component (TIGR02574 family)
MNLAEILAEIPKLSFAERQELVQRAIAVDDLGLAEGEDAILDVRMEDFRRDPAAGISLDDLKGNIRKSWHRE